MLLIIWLFAFLRHIGMPSAADIRLRGSIVSFSVTQTDVWSFFESLCKRIVSITEPLQRFSQLLLLRMGDITPFALLKVRC